MIVYSKLKDRFGGIKHWRNSFDLPICQSFPPPEFCAIGYIHTYIHRDPNLHQYELSILMTVLYTCYGSMEMYTPTLQLKANITLTHHVLAQVSNT